ncbi:hypothetical protein [Streptomyces gilvosporeus]|nr:hypothetical protein [Streptomyces gilvosporeus]
MKVTVRRVAVAVCAAPVLAMTAAGTAGAAGAFSAPSSVLLVPRCASPPCPSGIEPGSNGGGTVDPCAGGACVNTPIVDHPTSEHTYHHSGGSGLHHRWYHHPTEITVGGRMGVFVSGPAMKFHLM